MAEIRRGTPPRLGEEDRRRIEGEKARIRRETWTRMRSEGVARFPFPIEDRIPNFDGAAEAAKKLSETPEFERAEVVKVNPDAPQLPLRTLVVRSGKQLVMSVPRLTDPSCFRLFPRGSHLVPTIQAALSHGVPRPPKDVPHVDLVVAGSVAVGDRGERVGKGGGYADLEFALLAMEGKVDSSTSVATTIHPLQRIPRPLPWTLHDVPLDLVATPSALERVPPVLPRPTGILPEEMSTAVQQAIPWLSAYLSRVLRPGSRTDPPHR